MDPMLERPAKQARRNGPPLAVQHSGGYVVAMDSPLFMPVLQVEPSPTTGMQNIIPPLFQQQQPVVKRGEGNAAAIEQQRIPHPAGVPPLPIVSQAIPKPGKQSAANDDGWQWRKYGEKLVKGSPCPRSYYKCSQPGCPAKKIVERDANTSAVLSTQYKDDHNHIMPGAPRPLPIRPQRPPRPQMLMMDNGMGLPPPYPTAGFVLSPNSMRPLLPDGAAVPLAEAPEGAEGGDPGAAGGSSEPGGTGSGGNGGSSGSSGSGGRTGFSIPSHAISPMANMGLNLGVPGLLQQAGMGGFPEQLSAGGYGSGSGAFNGSGPAAAAAGGGTEPEGPPAGDGAAAAECTDGGEAAEAVAGEEGGAVDGEEEEDFPEGPGESQEEAQHVQEEEEGAAVQAAVAAAAAATAAQLATALQQAPAYAGAGFPAGFSGGDPVVLEPIGPAVGPPVITTEMPLPSTQQQPAVLQSAAPRAAAGEATGAEPLWRADEKRCVSEGGGDAGLGRDAV